MRKKIAICLVFLSAVAVSGCTKPVTVSQNIFQGYPCGDNCRDFQTGFETARDRQFTSNNQCMTMLPSRQVGCLSYIHEYQVEHEYPQGYVFPPHQ